jgi:uncharacterized protein
MAAAAAESSIDESLIAKVTDYVREYMSHYDGSHDFNHIQRVVHLARLIQASQPTTTSLPIVRLAALLHDVGDKKYLKPGEDASRLIADLLVSLGTPPPLADKVQTICLGVSYSGEVRDPSRVAALIAEHPELAVVQDADRLDAIGAVGIGRTFAFGGARGRALEDTLHHFDEKLVRLEGMMKTELGRTMARERTQRLRQMQEWWRLETEGVPTL